jgi:hypothetical protein
VDTDCHRAFITMELMRGLTLDKLLCERPLGLPWKELRDIACRCSMRWPTPTHVVCCTAI